MKTLCRYQSRISGIQYQAYHVTYFNTKILLFSKPDIRKLFFFLIITELLKEKFKFYKMEYIFYQYELFKHTLKAQQQFHCNIITLSRINLI